MAEYYYPLFRFLRVAVTVAVVLLAIVAVIWLLDPLSSIASSLDLQKIKTATEIINNVVIAAGVIAGGIWAYYKFARGRLFAPRIDLRLSQHIVVEDDHHFVIFVEVQIENIGSIRVLPQICYIEASGVQVGDNGVTEHKISFSKIKSPAKWDVLWYIEPGEVDFRAESILVPKDFRALVISVIVDYNKGHRTHRVFSGPLRPN